MKTLIKICTIRRLITLPLLLLALTHTPLFAQSEEEISTISLSIPYDVNNSATFEPVGLFDPGMNSKIAQAFTTGVSSAGYKLTEVMFNVQLVESTSNLNIAIHAADSANSDNPAAMPIVASAVVNNSYGQGGGRMATFATSVDLDPSTTYFVVFSVPTATNTDLYVLNVAENNPPAVGSTGWSIANSNRLSRNDGIYISRPRLAIGIKADVNPTANAGMDQPVNRDAMVTLMGGVDNPDSSATYTYVWTQIGTPVVSLSDGTIHNPTFTAPGVTTATTLTFSLVVTSNVMSSDPDEVVITVHPPTPPTAMAGANQTVGDGDSVTLTATGMDVNGDMLTYSWMQTAPTSGAGANVILSSTAVAMPNFTVPDLNEDMELVFELTVTAGAVMGAIGNTDTATVTITVIEDDAPTAQAGGAHTTDDAIGTQKVRSGVPIMLRGTAVAQMDSMPDESTLIFEWTMIAPPEVVIGGELVILSPAITMETALTATYTPTINGTDMIYLPIGTILTFELRVGGTGNPIPSLADITGNSIEHRQIDRVTITIGSPQEQTVTIVAEIARAFMSSTVTAISNRLQNANSGAQVNTAAASWNENSDKTFFSARALSRLSLGGDAQSMKAMLGKSDFQMPLGDAGRSAGGLAFWGSGAYSDLSGESDKVQWDGKLSGFHIGIDRRIKRDSGGDALLGIALSSLSSEVDYSDGTNVDVLASGTDPDEQGNYEIDMTTLSPYIGWNRGDVELWASAGFGMGEVQRNIGGAQPISIASDAQQLTAAFGGNGALFIDGSFDLRLKGELSASQFKLDGSADDIFIAGQTLDATRVRIGLYSNHLHKIGVGREITSTNEIGIRFDGGDGITGSGTEIGGQLRYVNSVSGLVVEGSARGLLGHNGDFNEWGIQGSVAKQNGRDGQGLAFYLTPVYGDVNSGVAELLASGLSGEVDNSAARDYHINLNTRLGYGIAYWGMVTPYSEMVFGARDELRMGVNWKLNSTFNLTLVGEEADVDSVRLLGEVNF